MRPTAVTEGDRSWLVQDPDRAAAADQVQAGGRVVALHGSWLNQIEIWFGVPQRCLLRRGEFSSKAHLARQLMAISPHRVNRTKVVAPQPLVVGDTPV